MQDKDKTREQLILELAPLRQRVAEMEKSEAEHKRVEEALYMSQERLNFLVSHSPATLFSFKASGDFRGTFMSENMTAQLGYKPCEFLENSRFWTNHVHPEDMPRLLAEMPRLFKQGHDTREYRMKHKDGTYRWVHEKIRLVRDESGNPLEIIGSGVDITERKEAEKEREELVHDLQKTLSEMKILKGIFPICASCKKIRDDKGYWTQVEVYIRDHSEAEFSHGICPECRRKLYGEIIEEESISRKK